tara:strand:+ start:83 stop:349 length:267 start_codon:yes stop_codon:yes gene_type:complete
MTDNTNLLQFPCNFPIKIIGNNTNTFELEVIKTVRNHYPDLKDSAISSNASKQGNYLAMTLTVFAQSQTSLDALYFDLNQLSDIQMVL